MEGPVGEFGHRSYVQVEEEEDQRDSDIQPILALELFQPAPNVLYSIDAAAHIAGVSRRSILVYCRAGLVRPVIQQPYGAMEFTDEAIYTLRKIEHLRTIHDIGVGWIKIMFDLLDQVERLRVEVSFLRKHKETLS